MIRGSTGWAPKLNFLHNLNTQNSNTEYLQQSISPTIISINAYFN